MSTKTTSDGFSFRDQVAEGTLDGLNDAVTLGVEDRDAFAMHITTGLTGTVVAEVSVDDQDTWQATQLISKADGTASSSLVNPSAAAYDVARTAGCSHVRIRCSAYTSGSCDVVLRGTETAPAGGGSGGAVEGVAATGSAIAGVDPVLIGGVTHTSLPSSIASNLLRNILVDEYGRLVVNLRDNSGNNLLASGLVVQLGATDTGATSLGKAEDAAHTTGDAGVMMLGVRNDAAATQTSANGDYGAISLDAAGRQFAYAGPVEEIVGTASTTTTLTNLAAVDCYAAGYTYAILWPEVATGTATIQVECSGDNTNWVAASCWNQITGAQAQVQGWQTGISDANDFGPFLVPIEAKYLRVRLSATSGGVTTCRVGFYRGPIPPTVQRTTTFIAGSTSLTTTAVGTTAHDGAAAAAVPLLIGGYAAAEIPADVSADNDAVRTIHTRAGQPRMVVDINATQAGWTPLWDPSITNTFETLKGTPGVLGQAYFWNTNTADCFIQFFNNAAPTVGTTTPTMVIKVPGGTSTNPGLAVIDNFVAGVRFTTAITYAATTTVGGSTAPASALTGQFSYK